MVSISKSKDKDNNEFFIVEHEDKFSIDVYVDQNIFYVNEEYATSEDLEEMIKVLKTALEIESGVLEIE